MTLAKLPPHSIEAEQSLIGGLLINEVGQTGGLAYLAGLPAAARPAIRRAAEAVRAAAGRAR